MVASGSRVRDNRDVQAGSFHELRRDAFNYAWDNSIAPALEVESGESVLIEVRDASDEQIQADSDVDAVGRLDFSHVNPVSGPIFVKGAKAGDVLEVELLEFVPRPWGWTAIIPGFGLLADEFPDPWLRISRVDAGGSRIRFSDDVMLPYRPFPGTIGVAPAEPGAHSILPPSRFGGNVDTKHLNIGTRLYLPVGVDGALFSLGDTHAAQGDGEVCGTAIETAMDVVVRLSVRHDFTVDAPQYHMPAGALAQHEQSSYHVCTGVGPDLLEASRDAVRATIRFLGERYGLDRQEAYAVASVAVDLRIHEIVDAPNWVVGAFIPEAIFQGGEA
jgi:acetamidase/formamidase